jgi:hypothetical protein
MSGFLDDGALGLTRARRRAMLHGLELLEYALSAPAPRRERTWQHRVSTAIDALAAALHAPHDEAGIDLLTEAGLTHPEHATEIAALLQDRRDIAVALESVREREEPDGAIAADPAEIRPRLETIAERCRQHQAREDALILAATGVILAD